MRHSIESGATANRKRRPATKVKLTIRGANILAEYLPRSAARAMVNVKNDTNIMPPNTGRVIGLTMLESNSAFI
jgi:hypothetical protein